MNRNASTRASKFKINTRKFVRKCVNLSFYVIFCFIFILCYTPPFVNCLILFRPHDWFSGGGCTLSLIRRKMARWDKGIQNHVSPFFYFQKCFNRNFFFFTKTWNKCDHKKCQEKGKIKSFGAKQSKISAKRIKDCVNCSHFVHLAVFVRHEGFF